MRRQEQPRQEEEHNNDFVLRMQATLFTMTSLLPAFTVVEAENDFRKVDTLVAIENSQINRLDRLLNCYGDESVTELRLDWLAYAKAIVDDEWPAMMRGERTSKVRLAFAPCRRESSTSNFGPAARRRSTPRS